MFLKIAAAAAVLIACLAGCGQPGNSVANQAFPFAAASPPERSSPVTGPAEAPNIVFAATEYDFGQMQPGTQKTAVFEFLNTGGQDLKLEQIYSTCAAPQRSPKTESSRPAKPPKSPSPIQRVFRRRPKKENFSCLSHRHSAGILDRQPLHR